MIDSICSDWSARGEWPALIPGDPKMKMHSLPLRRHASLAMTALLTVLLFAPAGRAQVSASIKGAVTDPTGAPVSAAPVKAKNLETGAMRETLTDEAGRYLVLSLPVGAYEVRVSKQGF